MIIYITSVPQFNTGAMVSSFRADTIPLSLKLGHPGQSVGCFQMSRFESGPAHLFCTFGTLYATAPHMAQKTARQACYSPATLFSYSRSNASTASACDTYQYVTTTASGLNRKDSHASAFTRSLQYSAIYISRISESAMDA